MKSITVVGCGVMGSRLINAMMNAGVKPEDIPNYYDVLEKYPKNGEAWD